jgi:hypothetical protein
MKGIERREERENFCIKIIDREAKVLPNTLNNTCSIHKFWRRYSDVAQADKSKEKLCSQAQSSTRKLKRKNKLSFNDNQ